MRTIFKYKLALIDEQCIEIPREHEILSVQVQGGEVCMWVIVDNASRTEKRTFYIHGTGHDIGHKPMVFIGTVQLANGALVFHVFKGGNQ